MNGNSVRRNYQINRLTITHDGPHSIWICRLGYFGSGSLFLFDPPDPDGVQDDQLFFFYTGQLQLSSKSLCRECILRVNNHLPLSRGVQLLSYGGMRAQVVEWTQRYWISF